MVENEDIQVINERHLLGLTMYYADQFDGVHSQLKGSGVFSDKRHQVVYEAMLALSSEGKEPTFPLVRARLEADGKLGKAGGDSYLNVLVESTGHGATLESFVELVREGHHRRRIVSLSGEMRRMAEENKNTGDIIDYVESEITSLLKQVDDGKIYSLKEILTMGLQELHERNARKDDMVGIPTGYKSLDRLTKGLKKSELVLIAARPSMGKTALGLNICVNVAKQDKVVVVFSLEMSAESLGIRIINSESRLRNDSFPLTDSDFMMVDAAVSKIRSFPLFIDETSGISIQHIRSKLKEIRIQYGRIDLVMVDYLQLMSGPSRIENRQQEVAFISRSLKALAKEFDCPMLVLSQLSRASEKRGGTRKPILSDLRDSGAIEQDADVVIFIHRDEYYLADKTPEELRGKAEIIVAKNRNGETNRLFLGWTSEIVTFDNLMPEAEQAAMQASPGA